MDEEDSYDSGDQGHDYDDSITPRSNFGANEESKNVEERDEMLQDDRYREENEPKPHEFKPISDEMTGEELITKTKTRFSKMDRFIWTCCGCCSTKRTIETMKADKIKYEFQNQEEAKQKIQITVK